MYGCYQPSSYQVEAHTWAAMPRNVADPKIAGLVESISDLTDTYTLVIGEAGPDWQHCQHTADTLADINRHIRLAYEQLNTIWARGYTQGCNS